MRVEAVRGMTDILPEEALLWQYVEAEIREAFALYGYREIRTPIVERAELFARGVGEATDIVHKEMYVFPDKKGQMLALRPEATASVVRAYLEHGLHARGGVAKLYYLGPMFRYEKPQKGRKRQFHQYGVEAIGSLDPALDAEVIDLAWYIMERLGLRREGLFLRLNSIGCPEDRPRYRETLREYFLPHREKLCSDCKRRLEENPLRILDCKVPSCREVAEDAPRSLDHLCPGCRAHFERLLGYLDALGLSYELDPKLVRGLDYYTRTVFELASRDLGAQDALLGGGRYDGLAEALGGPPTPGVGFAGGMERLILVLGDREPPDRCFRLITGPTVYILPVGEGEVTEALRVLARLRRAGIPADMDYAGRSLRKRLQVASQLGVRYALFLGEEELSRSAAKVRDLSTGQEEYVPFGELVPYLQGKSRR
ncbi:histidine--tRNA ligase [Candidatus Bipolaricaulota sp. J31]